MEMMIANCCGKLSSTYEFKKDKGDSKRSSKPSKTSTKEDMTISTGEPMRILKKSMLEGKKTSYPKEMAKKGPTL